MPADRRAGRLQAKREALKTHESGKRKRARYPYISTASHYGDILISPLDVASPIQIRKHLSDLRREKFIRSMQTILNRLLFHPVNRAIFNSPVDPVALKIPHYLDVIKQPMDLGTIKIKLLSLQYASENDFASDVRITFSNAMLFNPSGHVVHEAARILNKEFELDFKKYLTKQKNKKNRDESHSCAQCLSNVCGLCLEKCLLFEPPLLMCSGPCVQRIRRQAIYYTYPGHINIAWCTKCYSSLPKSFTYQPPSGISSSNELKNRTLIKKDLIKSRFKDEVTEPWVQCDKCNLWLHQICALYNERADNDLGEKSSYCCPLCRLEMLSKGNPLDRVYLMKDTFQSSDVYVNKSLDLSKDNISKDIQFGPEVDDVADLCLATTFSQPLNPTSSEALPETPMSNFIQCSVRRCLIEMGESAMANSIVVRLVSNVKSTCLVKPEIRKYFTWKSQQYPESIEYDSKALMIFQNIGGIEVSVFTMYVQEYYDSIESNERRAYIAYLDSVGYFRPRHARTQIFHETLTAYCAFSKSRGFTDIHIWACPPARGNDFIYWCHPQYQRTPGKARLLDWYGRMINQAKKNGIVFKDENLYNSSFSLLKGNLDKLKQLPPYFDGDFWPLEFDRLYNVEKQKLKKSKMNSIELKCNDKTKKMFYNQLSDSVMAVKDSLIVLKLQSVCEKCTHYVTNDIYFQLREVGRILCEQCYATHEDGNNEKWEKVTSGSIQQLQDREISGTIVDTRAKLLEICESHHYQFDTFRRAKYSTMMLLYHLHKPQSIIR